jgi:hypothetical protein
MDPAVSTGKIGRRCWKCIGTVRCEGKMAGREGIDDVGTSNARVWLRRGIVRMCERAA